MTSSDELDIDLETQIILNFYDYKKEDINNDCYNVKCKICGSIKVHGKGKITSNLIKHLREAKRINHSKAYEEYKNLKASKEKDKLNKKKPAEQKKEEQETKKQTNISQYINNNQLYPRNHQKVVLLNVALTTLLVKKSLSISIVDSPEFKKFLNTLDPRYVPPCSRTILNSIIPQMRRDLVSIIENFLQKLENVNIICDIWSDPNMRSYLGLGCQGITNDFRMFKCFLGSINITERHSGILILNEYKNVLSKYDLNTKIYKTVTDNASNMKKAFNNIGEILADDLETELELELGEYFDQFMNDLDEVEQPDKQDDQNAIHDDLINKDRDSCDLEADEAEEIALDDDKENENPTNSIKNLSVPLEIETQKLKEKMQKTIDYIRENCERVQCGAHTLQLAIKDSLKLDEIKSLIKKVSKFITHCKKSTIISEKLREINKNFRTKNETRWNSIYLMLKSIQGLKKVQMDHLLETVSIEAVKNKTISKLSDLQFTQKEREQINELYGLLEDVYIFTNKIQGDNVSISRLLPGYRTVCYRLNQKNPKHFNQFKLNLVSSIKKRFAYLEQDNIYGMSSVLDPNYCSIWCESFSEHKEWEAKLKNFIISLENNSSNVGGSLNNSNNSVGENLEKGDGWHVFHIRNHSDKEKGSPNESIEKIIDLELQRFIIDCEKAQKANEYKFNIDVLNFWHSKINQYPKLEKAARMLLGIPATSAMIERAFSMTGYIMRQHRRKLNVPHCQDLFF